MVDTIESLKAESRNAHAEWHAMCVEKDQEINRLKGWGLFGRVADVLIIVWLAVRLVSWLLGPESP